MNNQSLYRIRRLGVDWNWVNEEVKVLRSSKSNNNRVEQKIRKLRQRILGDESTDSEPLFKAYRSRRDPNKTNKGITSARYKISKTPTSKLDIHPDRLTDPYLYISRNPENPELTQHLLKLPFISKYKQYLTSKQLRIPGFLK